MADINPTYNLTDAVLKDIQRKYGITELYQEMGKQALLSGIRLYVEMKNDGNITIGTEPGSPKIATAFQLADFYGKAVNILRARSPIAVREPVYNEKAKFDRILKDAASPYNLNISVNTDLRTINLQMAHSGLVIEKFLANYQDGAAYVMHCQNLVLYMKKELEEKLEERERQRIKVAMVQAGISGDPFFPVPSYMPSFKQQVDDIREQEIPPPIVHKVRDVIPHDEKPKISIRESTLDDMARREYNSWTPDNGPLDEWMNEQANRAVSKEMIKQHINQMPSEITKDLIDDLGPMKKEVKDMPPTKSNKYVPPPVVVKNAKPVCPKHQKPMEFRTELGYFVCNEFECGKCVSGLHGSHNRTHENSNVPCNVITRPRKDASEPPYTVGSDVVPELVLTLEIRSSGVQQFDVYLRSGRAMVKLTGIISADILEAMKKVAERSPSNLHGVKNGTSLGSILMPSGIQFPGKATVYVTVKR